MAVNKVVINDKIALDLTGDTVTPSDLVEGVTAHDATGMQITGTRPATGGTDTSDATATAAIPATAMEHTRILKCAGKASVPTR